MDMFETGVDRSRAGDVTAGIAIRATPFLARRHAAVNIKRSRHFGENLYLGAAHGYDSIVLFGRARPYAETTRCSRGKLGAPSLGVLQDRACLSRRDGSFALEERLGAR